LNISIYSDRLVVESPGPLPVSMTIEQLMAGVSRIRNHAIVKILGALDLVEEHGTVYAKSQAVEREEGYPIPEWSVPGSVVRVVLKPHPSASFVVAKTEQEAGRRTRRDRRPDILTLLKTGPAGTESIASTIEVSKRRAQQLLAEFQTAGRVEAVGDPKDPNRVWKLASP
jgi:predicted HTH transcriptional regulator